MSDFEYLSESSLSSYGDGSSGNEADSEGEEVCEKDVKEITDMMKCFTPYMFEPEKDDVSSISSSSSEVEDEDENDSESKTNLEKSSRVENLEQSVKLSCIGNICGFLYKKCFLYRKVPTKSS